MKKSILVTLLSLGSFLLVRTAQAQVSLRVNIGNQPVWGPVGYDHADYYYFPDIDVYYNVERHRYIYWEGGRWMFAPGLPPRFGAFDPYRSYKVVLNEPRPWLHHEEYRRKYAEFRGRHDQPIIRESHDSRYFVIREHPEHAKWHGNEHDRGDQHDDHHHDDHDHH